MSLLLGRMIRAAKLDVHLYDEVRADKGALGQAMGIVVLSTFVPCLIGLSESKGLAMSAADMFSCAQVLFFWYGWVLCTYLIGTQLLPEPQTHVTHNELLRTVGFAMSPGIFQVLGIIPGLKPLALAAGIWTLVATVIAVRQALGYHSTLSAIALCVVALVLSYILFGLIGGIVPHPFGIQ